MTAATAAGVSRTLAAAFDRRQKDDRGNATEGFAVQTRDGRVEVNWRFSDLDMSRYSTRSIEELLAVSAGKVNEMAVALLERGYELSVALGKRVIIVTGKN